MRPKITESPMFDSWYDSNAHETPSRSVPKLCATVGIEIATILVAVPEKQLAERSEATFGVPFDRSMETIAALGKTVGPPWGKDQKIAALAAIIALR